MSRVIRCALVLGLFAALAGCSRYEIVKFEDHGNADTKLNQLEVVKMTSYGLWATAEHQFWLCTDKGDELECNRSCGGDRDIVCPAASAGGGVVSSNTR